MKTFKFVLIPSVVATLSTLSGCSGSPGKICVDQATDLRVDDEVCRRPASSGSGGGVSGSGGHGWYYLRSGAGAPAVGSSSRGMGSYMPAAGVSYGTVSRGGFGSSGFRFGIRS